MPELEAQEPVASAEESPASKAAAPEPGASESAEPEKLEDPEHAGLSVTAGAAAKVAVSAKAAEAGPETHPERDGESDEVGDPKGSGESENARKVKAGKAKKTRSKKKSPAAKRQARSASKSESKKVSKVGKAPKAKARKDATAKAGKSESEEAAAARKRAAERESALERIARPDSPAKARRRRAGLAWALPDFTDETAEPEPASRRLRIVSANLRNGRVDPDAFAELIRALAADVVALQEATVRHFEALAAELPHGEFESSPGDTGLGIAVRRPATPNRIRMPWRDARLMTLEPHDWPELGQPLDIVNVHIAAPHLWKPPLYSFVMRNKQVKALEKHFASPLPQDEAPQSRSVVLIGDFNATPAWPVYQRIASQFTDAAIAVAQVLGRPVEPTWSLPENTPRYLRIDHAFVRGVSPEEFQAVRIAGSDHSAIVVDITDRTIRTSLEKR